MKRRSDARNCQAVVCLLLLLHLQAFLCINKQITDEGQEF